MLTFFPRKLEVFIVTCEEESLKKSASDSEFHHDN